MEREKRALLIIDPQNDFCDPNHGALGVPGAEEDSVHIAEFIRNTHHDNIFVTMDTHYMLDISHPLFWQDENGNNPDPLTMIELDENGEFQEYTPIFHKNWAKAYLQALADEGKYKHLIWPYHCIHGSWGHMINENIMEALRSWSSKNKRNFHVIEKGHDIFTEHFGAFEAQVPHQDNPNTGFNKKLYDKLLNYDIVDVMGEAESHCVAYTLDQLIDTELAKKLVVYKNSMMSPVPGFENTADPVYENIKKSGAKIV